jgi:hypothetical protein
MLSRIALSVPHSQMLARELCLDLAQRTTVLHKLGVERAQ